MATQPAKQPFKLSVRSYLEELLVNESLSTYCPVLRQDHSMHISAPAAPAKVVFVLANPAMVDIPPLSFNTEPELNPY